MVVNANSPEAFAALIGGAAERGDFTLDKLHQEGAWAFAYATRNGIPFRLELERDRIFASLRLDRSVYVGREEEGATASVALSRGAAGLAELYRKVTDTPHAEHVVGINARRIAERARYYADGDATARAIGAALGRWVTPEKGHELIYGPRDSSFEVHGARCTITVHSADLPTALALLEVLQKNNGGSE